MLQNTPTVYLSRLASPSLQRFLQGNGFQLKSLDVPVVYPEISTHADILLCQLGLWEKAQIFHGDPEKLTRNYPGNIRYNAVCTGKYFIHNLQYTDPDLLAAAEAKAAADSVPGVADLQTAGNGGMMEQSAAGTKARNSELAATAQNADKIIKIEKSKGETTMKKTIKIEGMMCQHCVKAATKALEGVAGVTAVTVSLEDKQAVVEGSATDEALTAAIVDAGYEVKGIE